MNPRHIKHSLDDVREERIILFERIDTDVFTDSSYMLKSFHEWIFHV